MKADERDEHSTGHDKNCISLMNSVEPMFALQHAIDQPHCRECNNANRTFPWQKHLKWKAIFPIEWESFRFTSFDFQFDWQIRFQKKKGCDWFLHSVILQLSVQIVWWWQMDDVLHCRWNWISESRFMKCSSFGWLKKLEKRVLEMENLNIEVKKRRKKWLEIMKTEMNLNFWDISFTNLNFGKLKQVQQLKFY